MRAAGTSTTSTRCCARELVARLASAAIAAEAGRRADLAAGAISAIGRINFLFDRSQQPHLSTDQRAACLDVVMRGTPSIQEAQTQPRSAAVSDLSNYDMTLSGASPGGTLAGCQPPIAVSR